MKDFHISVLPCIEFLKVNSFFRVRHYFKRVKAMSDRAY
jgi:hypothetical protein